VTVYWSPTANEDRVEIYDHIERDSPDNAILVDDRILKAVGKLATFPQLGRPGRRSGTRELVIPRTPFIAAYRINENTVEILRIVRGARSWPHIKTKR
jgi:plasmid stabilization system protein ParE